MQAKIYEHLLNQKTDIVTSSQKEALLGGEVYKYLNIPYVVFPDFRAVLGDDLRSFRTEIFELNNALYKFYNENSYFISPYTTVLKKLPVKKYYKDIVLEFGDDINLNELKEKLVLWGYEHVDIVSEKGEVSFRGDIFDIWPINLDKPVRVSLFDTEIESIRIFEETDQKSIEEIESFKIIPAIAALDKNEYNEILDKINKSEFSAFYKDFYSLGFWYLQRDFLDGFSILYDISQEIQEYKEFHKEFNTYIEKAPLIPNGKCKDITVKNIKEYLSLHKNQKIEILAKNEVLLKEADIYEDIKLKAPLVKWIKSSAHVNISCPEKTVISLNPPEFEKRKKTSLVLDELKKGDFVVHESHGIGKFNGLKKVEILGKVSEYAEILYANDDKLLLPVENLNLIEKYIAPGGVIPALDKLGKGTFAKKREKIKEKIFAMAADIIKLQAQRELIKPAPLNFEGVKEFIDKAPFIHTPDQKETINAILEDFKTKVMDRLLSGDVGFGKTEVAMVASFVVAKSGYQVAVIAPTTILVNQHFESFKERFKDYPDIKIAKLDRFTSSKEKKEITEGVKNGEIKILISTHAGLNLKYKNLGLVIIDEEHKFGVKQKEKLKELAKDVHTLYMSATPIPRTLNMALSQVKSISTLETAPKGKKSTKTFVKEWNENLIKEVILRELRRGGQIFYIYNNIAYIEQKKKELQNILPDLRILVLHAKLTPSQIEKGLVDFIAGKYDLALTTTIVESGIHIPNVNTVIVENADKFGIADLHQIRGRVGRGKHEGYAYFLVKNKDELSEDAKKRLLALEENSFLGSGQVLAMRDLEIRGGGNILGAQQSGQIKGVGYSMYVKMLEDTLKELSGNKIQENETEVKLNINAYISDEVVKEDRLRLDLYKRFSNAKTIKEIYELEKEMIDRFSKLDKPTRNFIEKMKVKVLAQDKGIKSISNYGENITIIYSDDKKEFIKAPAKDDDIILETIITKLKDI
ncbi:transcription-repair coupling factor [Nautilia sp. PV-1]|uniref:DEAD/DEAH box helicase n=1 Tax=Nautilia sp. PV-1 TaxID=2579250 RepID=UPI000FD8E365|nr:DEAD/DEAH box helicase [Nautilia sp. PV-1]AZV47174.1 transcription-repair coupling factor [Nautilia sp. PV-1]